MSSTRMCGEPLAFTEAVDVQIHLLSSRRGDSGITLHRSIYKLQPLSSHCKHLVNDRNDYQHEAFG